MFEHKSPTRASNIRIETDDTDHFKFICPKCSKAMNIEGIESLEDIKTKITRIELKCSTCNLIGHRKMEWKGDRDDN